MAGALQGESISMRLRTGSSSAVRASASARSQSGIYGIQCLARPGRTLYRAKVIVGPFHLISDYHRDLAEVQRRLDVLLRVRSNVGGDVRSGASIRLIEGSFRDAVATEASRAAAGDGIRWRFQFFCSVPAKMWVGRALTTPCFILTAGCDTASGRGLEAGLRAWRRLQDARGLVVQGNRFTMACRHDPEEFVASWARLRQAYIDIWAEAGRCPQQTCARLSRLEAERAARLQAGSQTQMQTCREKASSRLRCKPAQDKDCEMRIRHHQNLDSGRSRRGESIALNGRPRMRAVAASGSAGSINMARRPSTASGRVRTSHQPWTAMGVEYRIQDLVLQWKC